MLISWQCTHGGGTSKTQDFDEKLVRERQLLNFMGAPELTRFLAFAALKETYCDDEAVVSDALSHIILDFESLRKSGISVTYGADRIQLRLACIASKGDWPWQITAGELNRNFRRAAKRETGKNPNVGICHLCMAGAPGVPCSDAFASARWIRTMGSAASMHAWDSPSPLTLHMPQMPSFPAFIYRPDIFHNWHLGMGQCFVASSIVILLDMCPGTSIPKRFERMTLLFRAYCRSRSLGASKSTERLDFLGNMFQCTFFGIAKKRYIET